MRISRRGGEYSSRQENLERLHGCLPHQKMGVRGRNKFQKRVAFFCIASANLIELYRTKGQVLSVFGQKSKEFKCRLFVEHKSYVML